MWKGEITNAIGLNGFVVINSSTFLNDAFVIPFWQMSNQDIVSMDIGELQVYNESQLQLRLQQCLRGKKVIQVLE